jgi:hypothetical protein
LSDTWTTDPALQEMACAKVMVIDVGTYAGPFVSVHVKP